MKTLALLFAVFFCQILAAETPTAALAAFQKAAKEQKFEDVWKRTAQYEGATEELSAYLKSRVERIVKLAAGGWDFEILEEKIDGDCAVVVINESTKAGKKASDIDPAFLIRQNGEWKILPEPTRWDFAKRIPEALQPASMKLDEKKIAAYQRLQKWFDERKRALQQESAEADAK